MAKATSTSPDEVRTSVGSIYAELLDRRKAEREARSVKKQQEREAEEKAKEEKKLNEDGSKKTKEERRQAELDAWKEIIVGLTGDDLEYSSPKGKRKKYKKWIGEDETPILTPKVKKPKKRNYRKEFEPELNMLKTIVADQNRFTADLQRRFQNAAGPATKDAMPLNKTLVELASAVNASRQNSLGLIREIGNLKKTIANLYMEQAKADAKNSGDGFNATDVGLMGSNIASSMFGDSSPVGTYTGTSVPPAGGEYSPDASPVPPTNGPIQVTAVSASPVAPSAPVMKEFNPETWEGPDLGGSSVNFENIPKDIVVEWHKADGLARFKAIDRSTGKELVGCPVPSADPRNLTFNEKDMTVKGEFDETYRLEIVG